MLFGSCTAAPNLEAPQYGAWVYTLTLEWETAQHGISHIDMIVDDGDNCTAEELLAGAFSDDRGSCWRRTGGLYRRAGFRTRDAR